MNGNPRCHGNDSTGRVKAQAVAEASTLVLSLLLAWSLAGIGSVSGAGIEPGWKPSERLDNGTGTPDTPRAAMNAGADAVVVWGQSDGMQFDATARSYRPQGGWTAQAAIEGSSSGDAEQVHVAIDDSGNATAVWRQYNSTSALLSAWANRLPPGGSWGAPQDIAGDFGDVFSVELVGNSRGDAFAVWTALDAYPGDIYGASMNPGGSWASPEHISANISFSAGGPDAIVDSLGRVTVVWYQDDGARNHVWAKRYVPGSGWSPDVLLSTSNPGSAGIPRAGVASNGTAHAVWIQNDAGQYSLWQSRFTVGGGWSSASKVFDFTTSVLQEFDWAVDAGGNGTFVWTQRPSVFYDLWAAVHSTSSGWGNRTLVSQGSAESADVRSIDAASSGSGRSGVVWELNGVVRFSSHDPSVGWQTAFNLSNTSRSAQTPSFSAAESGNGIATWMEFGPSGWEIWEAMYVAADLTPPAITLTEPVNNTSTEIPTIRVSGSTEPNVTLVIGGLVVAVNANGSFSTVLALSNGPNNISVSATDAAGNTASLLIRVNFNDPVPGLRQRITSLESELATIASAFNATLAELWAAESLLNETQSIRHRLATLAIHH